MTPDLSTLLAAVRRRTRLAWAVGTSGRVATVAGGLALTMVALGRLRHLPWADPAAAVVVATAAIGLVAAALLLRLPTPLVARVADRGLATGDAFSTALEVSDGPFAERVRTRAAHLAAGRRADEAVTLRPPWRWLGVAAVAALVAVALALLPNDQDALARQRAAERANADAAAAKTRTAAEEAAVRGADPAVVARLQELARQLERSSGEKASLRSIQQAAVDVASRIRPNATAERTAALGLESSLKNRPLVASGGSAAEQLRALAAGLASADQAATATRLDRLATTQSLGNPAAAKALADAAAALRAGNTAAAADALEKAGDAQRQSSATVASQAAAASALGDLKDVTLTAAPQKRAQGQGEGQGQKSGDGQGNGKDEGEGQGQGQGKGQGQGQGKGQGPPTGGGGGTSAQKSEGAAASGANAGGTGTEHTPGAQSAGTASVYDPPPADGPELATGGPVGAGPQGSDAGLAVGPNTAGQASVPLSQGLPTYRSEATATLDQLDLPPSVRQLVLAYFEGLEDL